MIRYPRPMKGSVRAGILQAHEWFHEWTSLTISHQYIRLISHRIVSIVDGTFALRFPEFIEAMMVNVLASTNETHKDFAIVFIENLADVTQGTQICCKSHPRHCFAALRCQAKSTYYQACRDHARIMWLMMFLSTYDTAGALCFA